MSLTKEIKDKSKYRKNNTEDCKKFSALFSVLIVSWKKRWSNGRAKGWCWCCAPHSRLSPQPRKEPCPGCSGCSGALPVDVLRFLFSGEYQVPPALWGVWQASCPWQSCLTSWSQACNVFEGRVFWGTAQPLSCRDRYLLGGCSRRQWFHGNSSIFLLKWESCWA